jgi:hypothetical protein
MNWAPGVILIVLGVIGLVWGGISYTTSEKVVDIGPIHATLEQSYNVPLSPTAGALSLVGGVALLVGGKKG